MASFQDRKVNDKQVQNTTVYRNISSNDISGEAKGVVFTRCEVGCVKYHNGHELQYELQKNTFILYLLMSIQLYKKLMKL